MATKTRYLVSDILEIISDLRGESTTNSDDVRIRAIDRAVGDFSTRRFWRIYRLDNQTITSTGVGDYEIGSTTRPYRIKGVYAVYLGDTLETSRCDIIDQNDYLSRYNADNSAKIAYEWYDASNDKWMLHVNPDTSGDTIYYSYYWQHPDLTATTDYVYCPDPDIIARRALAYLYEGEDEEKYVEMYQLSEQMADSWDQIENTPNVNQLYAMQPQSSGGIGSY